MIDDPQLPPYDEDAEKALLSLALLRNECVVIVAETLKPDDFYFVKHREIWKAMLYLDSIKQGIDTVTLADELQKRQKLVLVGGVSFLAELLTLMPTAAGIDPRRYATIVTEQAQLRGLIVVCQRTLEQAYAKGDVSEIAQRLEQDAFKVVWGGRSRSAGWRPMREVVTVVLDNLDKQREQAQTQRIGISTGLTQLDRTLVGWRPQELVIVGARPSMGKTGFALGASLTAARAGKCVGIVSLEMSMRLLGDRFLAMGAALDMSAVQRGEAIEPADWTRIALASEELANCQIWIDDTSEMRIEELRARARLLKIDAGLDMLVVDYLQLMKPPERLKRHEGLGVISAGLKAIAKELDCTVLAMCQVSRECEHRDNKKPLLSDLRESGSIEQDADVVLMLYRESVYFPEVPENRNKAEVLIRKNRNGQTGDIPCGWIARQTRFVDYVGYDGEEEVLR